MIKEATDILSQGRDLTFADMQDVMEEIMTGTVQTPAIVSFLTALDKKGESIEEITAAVRVMRKHALKINSRHKIILDTCGTGADRKGTFNISTVVAFVAAGAGIAVAKHGNRAASSSCGSADVLEKIGVNINMAACDLEKCLDDIGIAFLFAPNLHPAMKYVMPARKEIGKRTIFNILGPLSNPAGAMHQIVGVYDRRWLKILAEVLKNSGTTHALLVHGEDGMDEITTAAKSEIFEVTADEVRPYQVSPEDFGFQRAVPKDLDGLGADLNTKILLNILSGEKGPKRDIVVLNAAAAIYAADKASSIKEGIKLAVESIDSGSALKKLNLLREYL
ncbi:MAG: anthranilate phosphoribosyltransferase [Candidatus Omnitrophota bacterium]|nr:anthranilate phosphoribosyltransferase [Candidatus Omnitrophota bacterium]